MDALPRLAPVSEAYATLPVADAFNWTDGATELGAGEWYLVAFRSVRRSGADEARLCAFDELAHQEASESPGFVHYLKGPAALDGSCLSFCLWTSRDEARAAARQPAHVEAVGLLDEMYAQYTLEFLHVRRDEHGAMTFEPYRPPAQVHGEAGEPDPTGVTPTLSIRPAIAS
jgi:hypothetical protein